MRRPVTYAMGGCRTSAVNRRENAARERRASRARLRSVHGAVGLWWTAARDRAIAGSPSPASHPATSSAVRSHSRRICTSKTSSRRFMTDTAPGAASWISERRRSSVALMGPRQATRTTFGSRVMSEFCPGPRSKEYDAQRSSVSAPSPSRSKTSPASCGDHFRQSARAAIGRAHESMPRAVREQHDICLCQRDGTGSVEGKEAPATADDVESSAWSRIQPEPPWCAEPTIQERGPGNAAPADGFGQRVNAHHAPNVAPQSRRSGKS